MCIRDRSYEQLMTWAKQQDSELAALYQSSALPHSPDRNRIDALCVQMVEQMLSS